MDSAASRRIVEAYAAIGEHRTGSEADAATSSWLCSWLQKHGIAARAEPFFFRAPRFRAAYASAGALRVAGVPLHDAPATGAAGIEGGIAILEDASDEALTRELAAAGTRGALLVTGDPEGQVLLRNAERMDAPWPKPVLQIARRDAQVLNALSRDSVRLTVDSELVAGEATNVVADVPGTDGAGTVVLLTPKSGWFGCAGERGGGIALALSLAARAAALPSRRKHLRVLFTSGHELGHRGLLAYLGRDPARRAQPEFWLQLGASIGARNATGMRVFTRDARLRDWFPARLRAEGIEGVALAGADLRPHGESREVFDRPFLSMAGRHPYFHSPQDQPERCTDAEAIARHGRAFGALLDRLLA